MGLTPEEQLIALDLFSEEICYLIANHRYTAHELADVHQLIPAGQLGLIEDEKNDRIYATSLFTAALKSPLKSELYAIMVGFLARVDMIVHSCLMLCNTFGEFLRHVPQFLDFLDLDVLNGLDKMADQPIPMKETLTALREEYQNGRMSEQRYKRCILRLIPETGIVPVDRFLFHLYTKGSQSAKEYIDKIRPGFERYYRWRYSDDSEPVGVVTFVPEFVMLKTVFENDNAARWRLNVDLMSQRVSSNSDELMHLRIDSRSTSDIFEPKEDVRLREYQKELVKPALMKRNCIISAPTGSGKTIVAGHIILSHLREQVQGPASVRRVCFVVPNITLLEQQKKVCRTFLGDNAKINIVKGESKVPLVHTVRNSHVVLLTPQMLVNALLSAQKSTNTIDEFALGMFSLIVLDECHHTAEKHPYNKLMEYYHDMKVENNLREGETVPQIIGLTASLGIGSSKKLADAVNHIVKLCANLDSTVISTVTKNISDLQYYSAQSKDEIRLMKSDVTKEAFFIRMVQLMTYVEKAILLNHAVRENLPLAYSLASNSQKLSPAYLQWISVTLKSTLPELRSIEADERSTLTNHFMVLKKLLRTLELWYFFNTKSAMEYYTENSCNVHVPASVHEAVQALFKAHAYDKSEMLSELLGLLECKFRQNKEDSRVIIFVKECKHAAVLRDLLREDDNLFAAGVRSDYLISTSRSGDHSLTNEELREKLRNFDLGLVNVMCVTSVAEEGLDIGQCDLVIKYNYASNDIAHIQRRGRARQKNSRCVLFTCDEKLKQQEERNMACEELTTEAIQFIQTQPAEWLVQNVTNQISASTRSRRLARALGTVGDRSAVNYSIKQYKISCRRCDQIIGQSSDIFTVNGSLYLLCDAGVWSRSAWVSRDPVKYPGMENADAGQMYCRSCKDTWGRIILYENIAIPTVNCKAVVFTDNNGTRQTFPKWKKVTEFCFRPEEITHEALTVMRSSATLQFSRVRVG
uniref:RNA helicase n=1 Tax=Steinernema glaseri TaxID=37863 RepID=A0A1I7ZLG9_9BILA